MATDVGNNFFIRAELYEFFFFTLVAWDNHFADHNTLSSFAKTIENLTSILESESEIALNWMKYNPMIMNPGKFQALIFNKHKENHTNQIINIYKN